MRTTLPILALASLGAGLVINSVDLATLNFPEGAVDDMLSKRDFHFNAKCPAEPNSCGVVTYKSGTFTNFGQGTCMQVGSGVASIYVTKCYCSLWNTCQGNSNDVYVDGMMMCQAPKKSDEFSEEVKYISCGGLK
ncbi:hypothetical protein E8E12_009534 [Didymella heteroderae]|uniref:Uncharacterized protein n=1 Tax=Didymella heteroderae TaxID=1769908 RepID=A0A9P5C4R3_9PLEO|nr:hypothetical protein E8E12_009534 [Didymella heteroderae]